MFGFNKNLRIAFALPVWFSLAFLISYLALSRPRTAELSKQPNQPSGVSRRDAEKPARSVSLDSDADGIPDAVEFHSLTDRQNFRSWFSSIAEMQFYRLSDQWNVEQRDCAGLVRFAWREALRRHDRAWFLKMGAGYEDIATDFSYHLNEGPLGEKLFRTDFGTYKQTDVAEAKFSEFADARTLKNFNTTFISRDRRLAEQGDLLFFHQPWVQKFPYHVMIYLGDSRFAAPTHDWVVYHTGASPTDQGVVKKVELSVLDHHPNKRWRPVESNPNFLGFYRLKILD